MGTRNTFTPSAEDLERIAAFRLMDDDFMCAVFDDNPAAVAEVVNVVMGRNDLAIQNFAVQRECKNLVGHSVKLDVYAKDSSGVFYDIEVQRSDHGAGAKRARYNLGMMDSHQLPKSADYSDLPESYVIFITENDVLGDNLPIYHISRKVEETGKPFNDGGHIIYVNGAHSSDSPLGKLMADFRETDPDKMNSRTLAERVRYFKTSEEGKNHMCRMMEDLRDKSVEEGQERLKRAYMRLKNGDAPDVIMKEEGIDSKTIKTAQEMVEFSAGN